ncbi:TrmH family RNA methyltransferase [Limoniibacter endophyticus]|uniref:RNA methyltransferase n=1 Tax=Limoniibacter endophyticus TaxID=1565040 RepID=A0A8J3DFU0_9HYPH|nr:RNA methyltransferase [Limoniibacter endophyticus]GHC65343.1 RNA methyltransferase [Limoniibacter endophyticus]
MAIIPITDPTDARLADYVNIRERDLVGRQGKFVAEGRVVLNVLFSSSRFEAYSLLVLDRKLPGIADIIQKLDDDFPVYVVPQSVLDAVAGFNVHRGLLAIGGRRTAEDADAALSALPENALVLCLVNIANHDNMGAIFRNAAAFGADAILLDKTCCDPLYRKAIRVSVGAALKVPFVHVEDELEMHMSLSRFGFTQLALSPSGALSLRQLNRTGRTALYLGTEGAGLPGELMAKMTTVRIDMRQDFDSLNVATASAIALHHLYG